MSQQIVNRPNKIDVQLNPAKTQFILEPPAGMAKAVVALPHRRFNKRKLHWTAPVIYLNCAELRENQKLFSFTDEAKTAIIELMDSRKVTPKPFPPSYIFKTKPFEVQARALDYAYGLSGFALFMECGMGKSKVIIDLASARMMNREIDTFVILMPPSVVGNFVDEWEIHSPLYDVEIHRLVTNTPVGRRRADEYLDRNRNKLKVVVASIQGLVTIKEDRGKIISRGNSADILEKVLMAGKSLFVTDESQTIMNIDSKRTQNAIWLRYLYASTNAGIMTGTPLSVNILSLYSQFEFVDTKIIGVGDLYGFKSRFCIMGGFKNREVISYDNLDQLFSLLRPFTFVAKKKDWLDLPPKLYQKRRIEMTPAQKKMYKKAKADKVIEYDDDREKVLNSVLALIMTLHQISGGYLIESTSEIINEEKVVTKTTHELVPPSKNPKIRDLIEFIESTGKAPTLIWCKFIAEQQAVYQALEKEYPNSTIWLKGGSTDTKLAIKPLLDGDKKFIVSNVAVGGVGLTMNIAKYSFYFSNDLSPIMRMQSEDRNHRIGQDESVTVVDSLSIGSRDSHILRSLQESIAFDEYVKDMLSGKEPENIPEAAVKAGITTLEELESKFTEVASSLTVQGQVEDAIDNGSIKNFVDNL